jgi:myo-inositol-1(or 4)-monophosphatase
MSQVSGRELERAAIDVAEMAADFVRRTLGAGSILRTKSTTTDVVTSTDFGSEDLIRRELERRVPGSSFIGEEFPDHDGTGDVVWVIDPIDGTINFLYDLPVVAISIAACVDGELEAGAVADVVRRETFSARREGGARRDGVSVVANRVEELGEALVATGYSYDAATRAEQSAVVGRVLPAARDVRSMGSAALQLCWVGCGRLDAYYERDIKPWDMAAGLLIAQEAGAGVELPSDANGDLTFAAAPGVFDALRSLL